MSCIVQIMTDAGLQYIDNLKTCRPREFTGLQEVKDYIAARNMADGTEVIIEDISDGFISVIKHNQRL